MMATCTAMRTAMPKVTCGRITLCGAVDHGGVDLDAAVDRARVHDDGVGLGPAQLLGREAEALEDTPALRQQRAAHALVLQAQHDDHVAVLDALFQRVADAHAHLRRSPGTSVFGPTTRISGSPAW